VSDAQSEPPLDVVVSYNEDSRDGSFSIAEPTTNTVWTRLKQAAMALGSETVVGELRIDLGWTNVLEILREYGTKDQQRTLGFRFRPTAEAGALIRSFADARRVVQASRDSLRLTVSEEEIEARLLAMGFSRRRLKWFQTRDLRRLLSLSNGANFSVPGAGKTTVTFALHLLASNPRQHVLVVCPKAAFPAWRDVVDECMAPGSEHGAKFQVLSGSAQAVDAMLRSGERRFVINYDLLIQMPQVFGAYLSREAVHLIVDESHRMKAGEASQRGALLLGLSPLSVRRDILSGTPMPQSEDDLVSQLNFLWPGQGLGRDILDGRPAKDVLGELYVRTTKEELGLPPRTTFFHQVPMGRGQMALYALARNESLRQLSGLRSGSIDLMAARKSVMRLLQLSSNPVLALRSMTRDMAGVNSGIVDQVVADGPSPKMMAVADKARELAARERKSVIWTIFTDTIEQMLRMLADLNPVALYGAVPSGDPSDPATREGQLRRFHKDTSCMVMIANPAAAGEGISLHTVCHEALYLDRSYNSTHFLQSIDRIHRLGLDRETITNVHIFQTRAPQGVGCVDHSVSRRLATKVRALQQLLEDRDLHQIALDEENAADPVDYDIKLEDLVDLVQELEGRASFDEEEAG
jgi:hypothetical protein